MNNSNLEFRKVKSLDFLYEINANGTIIRNVKSKKQTRILLDFHHSKVGYYAAFFNIKGTVVRRMVHQMVAECWLGDKPKDMEIDHIDRNTHNNHYSNLRYVTHSEQMKNRIMSDRVLAIATANCYKHTMTYIAKKVLVDGKEFLSMTRAAKYLAVLHNTTAEHMRSKFKKRRSNIYGHDITYLNAETGCTHATA